ncbi:MAG: hypothetical protein ABH846_00670 [Patescibacteria group bacterium]
MRSGGREMFTKRGLVFSDNRGVIGHWTDRIDDRETLFREAIRRGEDLPGEVVIMMADGTTISDRPDPSISYEDRYNSSDPVTQERFQHIQIEHPPIGL